MRMRLRILVHIQLALLCFDCARIDILNDLPYKKTPHSFLIEHEHVGEKVRIEPIALIHRYCEYKVVQPRQGFIFSVEYHAPKLIFHVSLSLDEFFLLPPLSFLLLEIAECNVA